MQLGKVNSIKVQTGRRQAFTKPSQSTTKKLVLVKARQAFPRDRSGVGNSGHRIQRSKKINDGLLKEITNLKPVMRDSTSLPCYATTILGFVSNIEQICCAVTNANKAPFVMSQLVSK